MPHREPPEQVEAPHCDPTILHAPRSCPYCDMFPEWQNLRKLWQINFTNQYDIDKALCPSVYFRNPADRDAWPGNRPGGYPLA